MERRQTKHKVILTPTDAKSGLPPSRWQNLDRSESIREPDPAQTKIPNGESGASRGTQNTKSPDPGPDSGTRRISTQADKKAKRREWSCRPPRNPRFDRVN
jgi:hypothetical protein